MEEGKKGEANDNSKDKSSEPISRLALKKEVMRDLKYLYSKGVITNEEVYYLVKNFLRQYLNLDYEFTHKELHTELKKIYLPYNIRSEFFKFIEQLFVFEYSDIQYDHEELKEFLKYFEGFLEYLLIQKSGDNKRIGEVVAKNWFQKIKEKFKSKPKLVVQQTTVGSRPKETELSILDAVHNKHIDVNSLIEKIYYSLYNSDIDGATTLYKQVLDKYVALPKADQATYYGVLKRTYESIQNSKLS